MHQILHTAAIILMTIGGIGAIACAIALFVLKRTGNGDADSNA